MRTLAIALFVAMLISHSAVAQSPQPYAGLDNRPVKALSKQQIDDLKAGRGMGLALAAELNGYPGPVHALELADKLGLSDTQRGKLQALFAAMKAEAVPLGDKLIAQETALDRQFANRTVTETSLSDALTAIGVTQAALRMTHLKYHLDTLAALTPAQVNRYNELRGYAGDIGDPASHRHQKHFN